MTPSVSILAALLLLAGLTAGVAAVLSFCPDACDNPSGCVTLCLDCACCPNGASTPCLAALRIDGLSLIASVTRGVSGRHAAAPPAEILHVPKLVQT